MPYHTKACPKSRNIAAGCNCKGALVKPETHPQTQMEPAPRLTYFVGNANGHGLIRIEIDGTGEHVASMPRGAKSEAYAEKIVRAVNSFDDLLEACRIALVRLDRLQDDGTGDHSPAYLRIHSILAKAEGRS